MPTNSGVARARPVMRTVVGIVAASVAGGLLAIGSHGCQTRQRFCEQRTTQFYTSHNPEADFQRHDRRVYWALGIGRYYPGMSNEAGARLERLHGSRHLEGTTDVIGNAEEMHYIEAAVGYARAYNQKMAGLSGLTEARR